ncbi:hypothetical protein [Nonomuraea sp. NPDC049646]|uniref:hypothetical protein n=1 Tax=unclassified Nonomuraea TaxID=2593643 RepID=UPI0037AFF359
MTLTETAAARDEQPVDELTTMLNDNPDAGPEVADHLRGLAQSVALVLCAIAEKGGPAAGPADAAWDALQPLFPLLAELGEAMTDDAYRRAIAA